MIKRRLFFIFLIFHLNYWQESSISEVFAGNVFNECGGERALIHKVGDYCTANMNNGCCVGILACQTENTLMCVPHCNISVEMLVEIQKPSIECFNGGVYDILLQKCQCKYPYNVGKQCETVDACAYLDCGTNGRCQDGECICDYMFSGEQCKTRDDCNSPNKIWTGTRCVCAPGFNTYGSCDSCANNIVCIPSAINSRMYQPVYIQNTIFRDFLIQTTPPDGYIVKPFIPVAQLHGCECKIDPAQTSQSVSLMSLTENFASLTKNFDHGFDSTPGHVDYIHHLYERHYAKQNDCDFSSFFVTTSVFTIIGILLIMGCGFFIMKNHFNVRRENVNYAQFSHTTQTLTSSQQSQPSTPPPRKRNDYSFMSIR